MNNPHTQWRIDFARQLARRLEPFEGIQAVIVAGSVARGFADAFSDIEIPLFWKILPDDAVRLAIFKALDGTFLYTYDGPAQEDQLLIDGLQVDLWHISTTHEEQVLQAVLDEHQFDLGMLNALDTIRCCIPLYGQELVQEWKRRAQTYPDPLAEKIIQKHLASFSVSELFTHAQRSNPTAFYAQLSFLQQEAFLVLLALNRMYFPTFKWMYRVLASLPIQPQNTGHRFQTAFQLNQAEAAEDTQSIFEEILYLVEAQFPHLDTTLPQRRLSYRRAAHKPADGPSPAEDAE